MVVSCIPLLTNTSKNQNTMSKNTQTEKAKGDSFTQGIPTKIWQEEGSESNPYIAQNAICYGYDFEEILDQLSYVESLYLMLTGRIATAKQSQLLELCLKMFITPGPRHPATRAAMNAGIGRTDVTHILPISLSVLSAEYLGSKEVGSSMRFIQSNFNLAPQLVVDTISRSLCEESPNPLPGFGKVFNDVDILTLKNVKRVNQLGLSLTYFDWCEKLVKAMQTLELSWLPTGLVAAIFLDLDLDYRTGIGLFQMMQCPGLIAHGVEKANKPLTDMPFVSEENYDIKK